MIGPGGHVSGIRGVEGEGVGEIHVASGRQVGEEGRGQLTVQGVPAHVGNLAERVAGREAADIAGNPIQAGVSMNSRPRVARSCIPTHTPKKGAARRFTQSDMASTSPGMAYSADRHAAK